MPRLPGPERRDPFLHLLPSRTPGSLGIRDAADPDVDAHLGDTPGTLGVNDGASHSAVGRGGIPARMLQSMVMGAAPDAGSTKTGLFTYHVGIEGVAEAKNICSGPLIDPWRKAVYVEDVSGLVTAVNDAGYTVTALGILAHGDVGGTLLIGKDALNPGTIDKFKIAFGSLDKSLAKDAIVTIFGCITGLGKDGSVLLKEISRMLPGRRIVGFNVINLVNVTSIRKEGGTWGFGGHACSDPEVWASGVRTKLDLDVMMRTQKDKVWQNVATPDAPQAKVAKDGAIVKWPSDESPGKDDATLQERLKMWKKETK